MSNGVYVIVYILAAIITIAGRKSIVKWVRDSIPANTCKEFDRFPATKLSMSSYILALCPIINLISVLSVTLMRGEQFTKLYNDFKHHCEANCISFRED